MELKNTLTVIAASLAIGGAISFNNYGPIKEECAIYQGYKTKGNIAVFDDKPFKERVGAPDLVVRYNELEDIKNLEIGKNYLVSSQEKRIMGLPKLLSSPSSCD